jgi:NitT/TauT family transport system substrate-binding protein
LLLLGTIAALALAATTALAAPDRRQADTITVDTLPIANALPLDLGIQKGYFAKENINIVKKTFQSGNDIVLALANHQGDIGYIGYVPAMIARVQGIPVTVVAASEDEGATEDSNWQDVLVKGSSSIKTPADLAGKTIALNALKGVGETVVKAALGKKGVDPNSPKYVALPFPAMLAALNSGQVDAVHVPEPFLSQGLAQGDRVILAPGPVLGKYWPNGAYVALHDWTTHNPGRAKRFRTAINQSLLRAAKHPEEIQALLPPTIKNIRLPIWSPLIDRKQLLQLAKYAKQYGIISTLPNFTQLVPTTVKTGTGKKKT